MNLGEAAEALGKSRKTLSRWRKRAGCPLGRRGPVELDEQGLADLEQWAEDEGLLHRGVGRPVDSIPGAGREFDEPDDEPPPSADLSPRAKTYVPDPEPAPRRLPRPPDPVKQEAMAAVAAQRRAGASAREADAELKRLKLRQMQGELHSRAECDAANARKLAILVTTLRAIPGKCAEDLAALTEFAAVMDRLELEIENALRALRDWKG